MLPASGNRILRSLGPEDRVLDVGGWARPFARADWVLDLEPYETRGLYGCDVASRAEERFTAETWTRLDLCATTPWPFADHAFDFAICSHTLEDVRDPVRVCEELQRVARAGYVEVPSRTEEQCPEIQGPWVGWGHHHWLCDVDPDGISFTFKHHILNGREDLQVPRRVRDALGPEGRVQTLWWERSFRAQERVWVDSEGLDAYLREVVPPRRRRRLIPWRGGS